MVAPRGSRAAVAARKKKAARRADLAYAISCLVAALRQQAGIHVRPPSHQSPPFRAEQWSWTYQLSVAAATTELVNVGFTGAGSSEAAAPGLAVAEPFPEGHRGELGYFRVWALPTTAATGTYALFDPMRDSEVTLLRSGLAVPGYQRVRASSQMMQVGGGAAGGGPHFVEVPSLVPVHLVPGDTLQVSIENEDAADAMEFAVVCAGWIYPVRRDSPSIAGTIVD